MKAFSALYRATAREFFRDRMSVFITLLLPLVLTVFFVTLFSEDYTISVALGLAVEDIGPAGEMFAAGLDDPGGVLTVRRGERDELVAAVREGRLDAALVLPDGLSLRLSRGESSVLPLYHDPAADASGPAVMMVRQAVYEANQALSGEEPPLVLESREEASRRIPAAHLQVPGMMCLAILWLGVFSTAPPLVYMRENRVLRRMGVTPLRRSTLLLAQVGWRLTTGLIQGLLLAGFGVLALGISFEGSLALFVSAFMLGVLVLVSLGFLLAAVARSMDGAIALGQMVMFPMMFLSGTLFPLDMLPGFLRPVASAIPLTYLGDVLRQTMLGAEAVYPLGTGFCVLGGWLVVLSLLSVRLFRWE